ncbi:MAG: hypothetical protein H8D67_21475 [Deltaproteobacteria bacterium]|nr:hypothetical protein [Deltaproteobacteria bacterium]
MTTNNLEQSTRSQQDLIDDITLPLMLLEDYAKAVDHSEEASAHNPYIVDVLVDFARRHLEELARALEKKFGRIEVVHNDYDFFPWGGMV